jgi:hypothetical protein
MLNAPLLTVRRINPFANAYKPVPVMTITLAEAIKAICSGRYQRQVCELRQLLAEKGKRSYDKAKAKMSAFTFAGTFSPSRANEHLQQHSGIVVGDMDHVEDMTAAKRAISSDPHTVFVFGSPSATGLKCGVHGPVVGDDAEYKCVWQVISVEYERLYGGKWDVSGKDVSRLCFTSWDPDAYWNPEAEVFEVQPPPIQESPQPTLVQPSTATHTSDCSDDYAVRAIKTAVQMIQTAVLGTRHHTRLRAARLLGGYIAGGMLSYDQAYTVLEQALNGHTDDMAAALRTVKDGLAYGQTHPITIESLEAARQACPDQHFARNRLYPVHGDRQQALEPPVTDPWEGSQTLPFRPYTGYTGYRPYRGYKGVT